MERIMSVSVNTATGKGYMVIDYTGEAAIGLQGNVANPEGVDLLITNSYMWIVAPSVAAATMNVGPGVSGADNSELHGAVPLDGAAGTAWMGYHPAVTQDASLAVLWGAAEFVTFTTAAQSAVGASIKFYIQYIRAA
jgi:hypothetical protein